jgi:hypothetical protein
VNIMESNFSCDDLWLSSQERQSNDDCYIVQTITQLFDKVNIDLVNVHRKSNDRMMTITLFKQSPNYLTKSTFTWSTFVSLATKTKYINIFQIRDVATILL